jgi:hypothetical protein
MTRGQRRAWLALEEQKRRRARAAVGAAGFTISLDGDTLHIVQTGPDAFSGIGLQYSPDGVSGWEVTGDTSFGSTSFNMAGSEAGYYRVCWVDLDGMGHPPFSNIIHYVPPAPAIVLSSDGHGRLTWTANFTTPSDSISIYLSDDGVTWGSDAYDGWTMSAGARDCSGARGYFRICANDENGNDILPYSNVVYSDGL